MVLGQPVPPAEATSAAAHAPVATAVGDDPAPARAYMRRVEWDPRNLLTAHEIHYSEHVDHAGAAEDVDTPPPGFRAGREFAAQRRALWPNVTHFR